MHTSRARPHNEVFDEPERGGSRSCRLRREPRMSNGTTWIHRCMWPNEATHSPSPSTPSAIHRWMLIGMSQKQFTPRGGGRRSQSTETTVGQTLVFEGRSDKLNDPPFDILTSPRPPAPIRSWRKNPGRVVAWFGFGYICVLLLVLTEVRGMILISSDAKTP